MLETKDQKCNSYTKFVLQTQRKNEETRINWNNNIIKVVLSFDTPIKFLI